MKDLTGRLLITIILSSSMIWCAGNVVNAKPDNSSSLPEFQNETGTDNLTEAEIPVNFTTRIPGAVEPSSKPSYTSGTSEWREYKNEFYSYLHYASEPLYMAQKGLFLIKNKQNEMDASEYEEALQDLKTRVQNRVSEFEELESPEGFERVKSTFRENNTNIINLLDTFKEKKTKLYQEIRSQVKSDRLQSLKVFRDALQETNAPTEVLEEIDLKIKTTQKKLSL